MMFSLPITHEVGIEGGRALPVEIGAGIFPINMPRWRSGGGGPGRKLASFVPRPCDTRRGREEIDARANVASGRTSPPNDHTIAEINRMDAGPNCSSRSFAAAAFIGDQRFFR